MTRLDERLVPTAKRLIEDYGRNAIFNVTGVDAGDYNPLTLKTTKPAVVPYTRKISPPYPYEQKYVDGETVKASDLKCYVADKDLGFTPVPGMEVADQGTVFVIVSASPISTGELVAVWELQLRK